jgi:hypothetical protein
MPPGVAPRTSRARGQNAGSSVEKLVVYLLALSFIAVCYATYLLVVDRVSAGCQVFGGVVLVWLISYFVTLRTRALRRRQY